MANKKFSEFVLKTSTSDVSHIVGYNGAENVQITPANFVTTGGTGVFLPLAGGTMVGNTTHNDNVKSIYGTSPGNDLQIYHDSLNSFIDDTGTGSLFVRADASIELKSYSADEFLARLISNDRVELYFNGSKKFETTSTGISVTGNGVFTGDVNITQSTDVGVLNTTNLESGAAVGLSLTYPTSNVDAGDGLAISIGISGRGRSYIANSNLTNNLDASNLEFYTESGGVINKVLTLSESKDATFAGNVTIASTASPVLTLQDTDATATFNKSEIQNSTGSLLFNTRQSNGTFVSTDYLQSKNATGTITHQWFTSGTEKMRLDSSGNLGVSTSSPVGKIHAKTSSLNGASQYQGQNFGLIIETDGQSAQFDDGNGIVFTQDYDSGNTTQIRTGAVIGYKAALANSFGGGLKFKVQQFGALPLLTAMTLDMAGNLGVGTSTPAYKLQVAGSVALDVMAGNETEGAVRIGRSDANTSRYNDIKSFVSSTAASNYLKLSVHGGVENATVDVMTLLGNGNVGVAGDLVISTSGKGILLGGTAAANRLSEYEEGICTLRLTSDTAFDNESDVNCNFTRVGNLVTVFVSVNLNGTPSGGSGNVKITGLPFTAAANGYGAVRFGRVNLTSSIAPFGAILQVSSGTTECIISFAKTDVLGTLLTAATMNSSAGTPLIDGVLTYRV